MKEIIVLASLLFLMPINNVYAEINFDVLDEIIIEHNEIFGVLTEDLGALQTQLGKEKKYTQLIACGFLLATNSTILSRLELLQIFSVMNPMIREERIGDFKELLSFHVELVRQYTAIFRNDIVSMSEVNEKVDQKLVSLLEKTEEALNRLSDDLGVFVLYSTQ